MRLTGITYEFKAKPSLLSKKRVELSALKGIELSDRITSQWFVFRMMKFKSSFRALLFTARVNKKQFKYYPHVFKMS